MALVEGFTDKLPSCRHSREGGNPVRQIALYLLDPRRSLCPEGAGMTGLTKRLS